MIYASTLRSFIQDQGSGTPVVLLHGLRDISRPWRDQIGPLVEAGFRAIAPDLRGRGRAERPAQVSDYRLAEVMDPTRRGGRSLTGASKSWKSELAIACARGKTPVIPVGSPWTGAAVAVCL